MKKNHSQCQSIEVIKTAIFFVAMCTTIFTACYFYYRVFPVIFN